MKKIFMMLVCSIMALGIAGCSGSDDMSATQKKIEEAGWKIDLQRDAGTAVDYLTISINDAKKFSLTRYKEDDEITSVDYTEITSDGDYTIWYQVDDEKNYLSYSSEYSRNCTKYNLTDNEADEEMGSSGSCPSEQLKKFENVVDSRDKLLSDHDLSCDELYDWAVWYYKNN